MANNNGGRVCPKCGMNLGQKHLCPVCDKTETETEQERLRGGKVCPKCGMNLGQKHLCPVCDRTEPESPADNGNTSASNSTPEPDGSASNPESDVSAPEPSAPEPSAPEHPHMGNAGFARLMGRLSLLMDQHDWQGAGHLCREIIALEPENAELYFHLAMIELEVSSERELWKANRRLSGNQSFQTAMRLADPEFKKRLYQMRQAASVEVVIPDGETRIGNEAFKNCAGMTSIVIPDSVTEIGEHAFDGCVSLTSVTLSRELTQIAAGVFRNCISLTSVAIPNYVTVIGNNAFEGCSALTSVVFPRGLTEIGESAFDGCSGLTSVAFPNSILRIGVRSFADCRGLNAVELPDSLRKVGKDAFLNVPPVMIRVGLLNRAQAVFGKVNVISIVIAPGVTTVPEKAFSDCSGLVSVTIPDTVTSIGANAFSSCSGLSSITIPNSVTMIGGHAFFYCTGLSSVTIPNSVTTIEKYAFYHCSGLSSVVIPNSVTKIGEYAFSDCDGLTSVTIPDSVTTIGSRAFSRCTGLTSVTIPKRLKKRKQEIFDGCPNLPRPMERRDILLFLVFALICIGIGGSAVKWIFGIGWVRSLVFAAASIPVLCFIVSVFVDRKEKFLSTLFEAMLFPFAGLVLCAVKPVFGTTWRNTLIADGIFILLLFVCALRRVVAEEDDFFEEFLGRLILYSLPLLAVCGLVNWCFSISWWGIAIVGLVVVLIFEIILHVIRN